MADSPSRFKPGQTIRCTVTEVPRRAAGVDTLERLMRMEPGVKKSLRQSQRRRRQGMVVYNRGNRDWYKREECGKMVRCTPGASWTMAFSPLIAPELASLAGSLKVEAA